MVPTTSNQMSSALFAAVILLCYIHNAAPACDCKWKGLPFSSLNLDKCDGNSGSFTFECPSHHSLTSIFGHPNKIEYKCEDDYWQIDDSFKFFMRDNDTRLSNSLIECLPECDPIPFIEDYNRKTNSFYKFNESYQDNYIGNLVSSSIKDKRGYRFYDIYGPKVYRSHIPNNYREGIAAFLCQGYDNYEMIANNTQFAVCKNTHSESNDPILDAKLFWGDLYYATDPRWDMNNDEMQNLQTPPPPCTAMCDILALKHDAGYDLNFDIYHQRGFRPTNLEQNEEMKKIRCGRAEYNLTATYVYNKEGTKKTWLHIECNDLSTTKDKDVIVDSQWEKITTSNDKRCAIGCLPTEAPDRENNAKKKGFDATMIHKQGADSMPFQEVYWAQYKHDNNIVQPMQSVDVKCPDGTISSVNRKPYITYECKFNNIEQRTRFHIKDGEHCETACSRTAENEKSTGYIPENGLVDIECQQGYYIKHPQTYIIERIVKGKCRRLKGNLDIFYASNDSGDYPIPPCMKIDEPPKPKPEQA